VVRKSYDSVPKEITPSESVVRPTLVGSSGSVTTTCVAGKLADARLKALESHYRRIRKLHLRKLFAADSPLSPHRLTAGLASIYRLPLLAPPALPGMPGS
jgi:hypothetical protein